MVEPLSLNLRVFTIKYLRVFTIKLGGVRKVTGVAQEMLSTSVPLMFLSSSSSYPF